MTPVRYTAVAIVLHWLMAALLLGLFAVGLYMVDLPLSPRKLQVYSWHKWAGVTAFAFVLVRLAWRAGHPPPPLPASMAVWERAAAAVAHGALYVLMLAIPLSGWLMSSAMGFQTVWFGVLPIPDLIGKNEELGDLLRIIHISLNYTLAGLVLLHIGAALKHRLINRDDVFGRMWPSGIRKT